MRLTSLKHNSVVALREMFLSRFYDLWKVEHCDRGGWIRLRHLTGQSTSATWELFSVWKSLCLESNNKGELSGWVTESKCSHLDYISCIFLAFYNLHVAKMSLLDNE